MYVCAIGECSQNGETPCTKRIGTLVFKYRILLIEKFVDAAVPVGFASVG